MTLFKETTCGPCTTLIDYGEPTPIGRAAMQFAVVSETPTREWLAYFRDEEDAKAFASGREGA